MDERDGRHDPAQGAGAHAGGVDRLLRRRPEPAQQEQQAKHAEPHRGQPSPLPPSDLLCHLAPDGQHLRPQSVISDPRPMLGRRCEEAEPGHIPYLLLPEKLGEEDDEEILCVWDRGSPGVRFPHRLQPYIAGREVQLPIRVMSLLSAAKHHPDLHRLMEVDLKRARPGMGAHRGVDRGLGRELIIVPCGAQHPVRICAPRTITCQHTGQFYKFLVRLCNDDRGRFRYAWSCTSVEEGA